MAEDKRPFLLYTDLKYVVNKLSNDKAGELFKIILAYVNDEDPVITDMVLDLVFEPIRQTLKRDLVKYNTIKEKRAAAGRQGGIKSGETRSKTDQDEANEANEANASSKADMPGGSQPIEGYRSDTVAMCHPEPIEVHGVSEPVEVLIISSPLEQQAATKLNQPQSKPIPLNAVPNSPYGDGILHYRAIEWDKANANKYEPELFKEFLSYWTAHVQKGRDKGRELWKTKLTFEIGQRLATWAKNQKQSNQNGNKPNTNPADYLTKTARDLEAIFSGTNSVHHPHG